ncbi:MAG TPA: metalloregulator ArsR/SmtB family transcription factor [Chloroflexia bacterium]|nr:metalloregulator ArsR/SmtB family transcription factor [Chloroflexia bacterium]
MKQVIELVERKRGVACCTPVAPRLTSGAAEQFSADLALLAHPVRVQILDLLAQSEGQVCVCDLESGLPVKQPTVSHHLRLLREAGLIDCEKQGLWAYYFVKREALTALRARIDAGFQALG